MRSKQGSRDSDPGNSDVRTVAVRATPVIDADRRDEDGASGDSVDMGGAQTPPAQASSQSSGIIGDILRKWSDPPLSYRFLRPPLESDEMGRLGNYRVLKLLGSGGMAYVFLAEDLDLHRRVALKVMKPFLDGDPSAWQRFQREARILASIKHEHLVTVFQVGQEDNVIFLAMEWLQGQTLEDWVQKRGPAKAPDVFRLAIEMATGLNVIHGHGLIHRDFKPSNIWLEKPGKRVKLLDFGLARPEMDDAKYTQTGNIVGTPAFMSPEQARGDRLDGRSDLFSLGGVLYYLCTGSLPFPAETVMGMLTALAVNDPVPVHDLNPELPRGLADLIMQLLAKDVEDRPASAKALIERLRQLEKSPTATAIWDDIEVESPKTEVVPKVAAKQSRRKRRTARRRQTWIWGTAIGSMIAVIAVGGIFIASAFVGSPKSTPTTAAAVAGAPSPSKRAAPSPAKQAAPSTPGFSPKAADVAKVYLSELEPFDIKDWIKAPPPPPKDFGPKPPPKDFGPMLDPDFAGVMVKGIGIPFGIFMHPPLLRDGGKSHLSYRLDKKFSTFATEVSINDGPIECTNGVTFTVYGDDRVLWKSKVLHSQNDSQTCNIPVKNIQVLTIEVDCPGHPHGAHAVWINPLVLR